MSKITKFDGTFLIDTVKIDSFRAIMSLNEVVKIPEIYYRNDKIISDDGEHKKDIPNIDIFKNNNINIHGITTNFEIKGNFLKLHVNAKQLKTQYGKGIRSDNIRLCYDLFKERYPELIFTFDSFLNATIVDIDFCKDILIKNLLSDRLNLMKSVKQSVLNPECKVITQSNQLNFYIWDKKYKTIRKDTNGFQVNARKYSDLKNSHAKGYVKFLDLIKDSNSAIFKDLYLKESEHVIKDMFRLETKLHNREQVMSIVKSNKLKDVLKFDFTDRLNTVFDNYGLNWLSGYEIKKTENKELNIKEIIEDSFFKNQAIIIDLKFENFVLSNNSEFKLFVSHLYIEDMIRANIEAVTSKQNYRTIKKRKGEQIELFSKFISNCYRNKINAGLN